MADPMRLGDLGSQDVEERRRAELDLEIQECMLCKINLLHFQLASSEERIQMVEPLGWMPEIPPVELWKLVRFLRAWLAEGGIGKGIPHF
jgi:hypothetical protein